MVTGLVTRRNLAFGLTALIGGGIVMSSIHAIAAQSLRRPKGKIICTVSGAIQQVNADNCADFDHTMLDELPKSEIRTVTPWNTAITHFAGPRLRTLLDTVGAKGSVCRMFALNDYQVDIPVEDADRYSPILALTQNGNPLSVRERGPIWLMYPFDAYPEIRTTAMLDRPIWQLRRIEVRS